MKAKLTSRKFWMAVAAFTVGVLALFQVDANTTQQISGVIMSLGAVIAYIVGEGLVDASAASTPNVVTQNSAPVIGTLEDTAPADTSQTATAEAAAVKNDTALSTPDSNKSSRPDTNESVAPITTEYLANAIGTALEALQSVAKAITPSVAAGNTTDKSSSSGSSQQSAPAEASAAN